MGVATIYNPKLLSFILILFIFITSCAPVKLLDEGKQSTQENTQNTEKVLAKKQAKTNTIEEKSNDDNISDIKNLSLEKNITVLISKTSESKFTKQFINILELGIYDKKLDNVSFDIQYFEDINTLQNIIKNSTKEGKVFVGPIETKYTKVAKTLCSNKIIIFSFASDSGLADDCVYLLNFFPKNELEELFKFLKNDSKVALLYPENKYGYMINLIIDDIVNNSESVLVNRSSYKNDLSNVRDAIKELGKYELRKYELERQKQILYSNNDKQSKKRLKKLEKFRTTNDYDFTHILIADYGLNLLQVAPLLPYYDIDPNIVQFLGTGVIDDENFFIEPSLQGAIFPGVEKSKRIKLINQYKKIYDENLLRISTLPFDLVGLLNFIFSNNLTLSQTKDLLNNDKVTFDGIDGEFYFKDNMIKRNLDILKIYNGSANKIN